MKPLTPSASHPPPAFGLSATIPFAPLILEHHLNCLAARLPEMGADASLGRTRPTLPVCTAALHAHQYQILASHALAFHCRFDPCRPTRSLPLKWLPSQFEWQALPAAPAACECFSRCSWPLCKGPHALLSAELCFYALCTDALSTATVCLQLAAQTALLASGR